MRTKRQRLVRIYLPLSLAVNVFCAWMSFVDSELTYNREMTRIENTPLEACNDTCRMSATSMAAINHDDQLGGWFEIGFYALFPTLIILVRIACTRAKTAHCVSQA